MQGELERVLGFLAREKPIATCAGRTDTGVHARGQVVHVDVRNVTDLNPNRINRALPDDIQIMQVTEVTTDFDARFSALWRRYSYTVCDGIGDPIDRRRILNWYRSLDVDRMNEAAAAFIGEHDFSGYCKQRDGTTTIRSIYDVAWVRQGDLVRMNIRADAFCHSMVRSLVGAFLPVGDGRQAPEWAARGLAALAWQPGITAMPPHPLVLEEVGYPPVEQWAQRQHDTRLRRASS